MSEDICDKLARGVEYDMREGEPFDIRQQAISEIQRLRKENERLCEALSRIGASAPNHCVCCTMMGITARNALKESNHD